MRKKCTQLNPNYYKNNNNNNKQTGFNLHLLPNKRRKFSLKENLKPSIYYV